MLHKKIYLVGEINEEMYLKFSKRLTTLESQNHVNTRVMIELFSHGGDARTAIAIAGRMRNSSLVIHITAYGFVASAAVLVLAAGEHRSLAKDATVMVHEDSAEFEESLKTCELEATAKQARADEEAWARLLAINTKATEKMWLDLHKNETYLSAEECLKLGLVDELI